MTIPDSSAGEGLMIGFARDLVQWLPEPAWSDYTEAVGQLQSLSGQLVPHVSAAIGSHSHSPRSTLSHQRARRLLEEVGDLFDDICLLGFAQFGIHRQGQ